MLSKNTQAVVLAAGKSSRFNTGKTKLAEKICGRPMILYPTYMLEQLGIETIFVVGHQKEVIQKLITNSCHTEINKTEKNACTPIHQFVHQKEQLGTGHAVACTKHLWNKDHILVLNGDVPLVTPEVIKNVYNEHTKANAAISFVVSHYTGIDHAYGRVVQDDNGIKIVEAKDFNQEIYDEHCSINAGIYLIKTEFLQNFIDKINTQNAAKEFYLTSLVELACKKNLNVVTSYAPYDTIRGINTCKELCEAEQIQRTALIQYWMNQGVRMQATQTIYLDVDITMGAGTYLDHGVHILTGSHIGKNCNIRTGSTIDNAIIEDNVDIFPHTIIKNSHVCSHAEIGPFAHIHTHSHIDAHTKIGNFVEVKQTTIGTHSCAKHLSYLGNAVIGSRVNIGAGTITCNYDGLNKHATVIEDKSFIGSSSTLIAPITIEQGAYTAAGSTITEDVPQDSLAIARAKQINKQKYVRALLEKLKNKSIRPNNQNNRIPKDIKKQHSL